ncbi:BREX-1 system phosphatase PglZ type A [Listeria booriae]|uniref:BREX-1 system phosphatase PglZ type A n=1 Tax=Listeria booriae TaxID=1552123 RepID=A0A842FHZ1_9LIST|nr:BREX-1 system phosphatase PglZ type A [Listeria booriae]MBC2284302.1 BREX-1 system phosphatase PglZ type A [Listeria booriae]MBC2292702.1 BREX-1 system phosphatase PglZ type A [Listeria booriae]
MGKIEEKLTHILKRPLIFGRRRHIIFWYDESQSYLSEVEMMKIDARISIVTENNYFRTRYMLENLTPPANVVLYFPFSKPKDEENPLLDIMLYSELFEPNEVREWQITYQLTEAEIKKYTPFFQNKERKKQFIQIINSNLIPENKNIRYAILATVVKAKNMEFSSIVMALLTEYTQGEKVKLDFVRKFVGLDYFWNELEVYFNYQNKNRSLSEFGGDLFLIPLQSIMKQSSINNKNRAYLFLERWSEIDKSNFEKVSEFFVRKLGLRDIFKRADLDDIANIGIFSLVQEQVVQKITIAILEGEIKYEAYLKVIQRRQELFAYDDYLISFAVLESAIQCLDKVGQFCKDGCNPNKSELWSQYVTKWSTIDHYYRLFYEAYDSLLDTDDNWNKLQQYVENTYKNRFLLPFAEKWSASFQQEAMFEVSPELLKQEDFFTKKVKPLIQSKKRTVIIISDALRLETANELAADLKQKPNFQITSSTMVGAIPSYTDLAMALLLPHKKIELINGKVYVNGVKSSSLNGRRKILKDTVDEGSTAFTSAEILEMTRAEVRSELQNKKLIYIYANTIDAIGDHASSEKYVFEACKDAIHELKKLIIKLNAHIRVNHVLITADHGFIYTRGTLKQADKIPNLTQKAEVKNRRFFMQEERIVDSTIASFPIHYFSNQNYTVHIPKGINRFQKQGAGSNYVHGGYMPQEVALPIIDVQIERNKQQQELIQLELVTQSRTIHNAEIVLTFMKKANLTTQTIYLYFENANNRIISNRVKIINQPIELGHEFIEVSFMIDTENPEPQEINLVFEIKSPTTQKKYDVFFLDI